MSGRTGVAVTISATDAASAKIDAINKRLAAMNAPVDRVQKSLAKFADLSGISKLQRGVEGLASSGVSAFESLGRIVPVLGTLTGAASLAGMAALVFRWGEFGQKLQFAATRAGLSAQALHTLQGGARLAGASADDLTSGITTLGDTLTNAVGGRNPQAYSYLKLLGVEFQNVDGSAKSTTEVLPKLADAMKRIQNPTLYARVGTELLGGAFERLAPWLRRGSAGMAELDTMTRHYGVTTEAGTKAAMDLEMAHQRLMLSVDGLTNSIGEKLAPILGPMLIQMAEWVAKNREWVATGIGDAVKDFATWVQSVDWKGIGEGTMNFARGADHIAQSVGGWHEAAKLLFEFWVGKMTLGILASIARIDAALGGSLLGRVLGLAGTTTGALALPLALSGDTPQGAQPQETGIQHWLGQGGVMESWIRSHIIGPPAGHAVGGGRGGFNGGPRVSPSGNPTDPRGIRNNNPLNLEYREGQGAAGSDGRFGIYPTMDAGVAAAERQLLRYQDVHGLNTVSGIINRWAPPGENDSRHYASTVAGAMHADPNAPINLHDPATLHALVSGMAQVENGRAVNLYPATPPHRLLTGAEMQPLPRGYYGPQGFAPDTPALPGPRMDSLRPPVNINSGSGASGGGDLNVKGGATLSVKVRAPPGTTVGAATSGDLFQGAPRIEQTTVGRSPGGSP